MRLEPATTATTTTTTKVYKKKDEGPQTKGKKNANKKH
jgi:hypothetical protein